MSRPVRSSDQADLLHSLRAARRRASDAVGELDHAWRSSPEVRAVFPIVAVDDLVDAIAAAASLTENTADPELRTALAVAGARAQRAQSIATRSREALLFRELLPYERTALRLASEKLDELTRQLEAAERHVSGPELFHPSTRRGRVTVQAPVLPPGAPISTADIALPPGSAQPVEITLPGTFLWLAVLLLPSSFRGRYHEEFRAELRDLPPNQQVGYAARQCLQALALRRDLMAGAWAAWAERRRTRGDRQSEGD